MTTWPYCLASLATGFAGLAALLWGLRGDRSSGRPRCPNCWYMMVATSHFPVRCPECGHEIRREDGLFRTRRQWKWIVCGIGILIAAAFVSIQPRVQRSGYESLLPVTALILTLYIDEWPWVIREIENRLSQEEAMSIDTAQELERRLWRWQWRMLGKVVLEHVNEERFQHWYWIRLSREFSSDQYVTNLIDRRFASGLVHENPRVREMAARHAGCSSNPAHAVAGLRPLLNDPAQRVRQGAVLGLRRVAVYDRVGIDALLEGLSHEYADVRAAAARRIGELAILYGQQLSGVCDWIAALEDDSDCEVRESAVVASSQIEVAHRRWPTIEAAIASDDVCIRRGGYRAIYLRTVLEDTQSSRAPKSVQLAVIEALHDKDDVVRRLASNAMEHSKFEFDIDVIAQHRDKFERAANHEDPRVRRAATIAIYRADSSSE